jgi:hypothetical protein
MNKFKLKTKIKPAGDQLQAKAYAIKDKYQAYLARQRRRLANSRRIKSKEQIEKVMQFIDAKLNQNQTAKINLQPYKLELIKCELCSWT